MNLKLIGTVFGMGALVLSNACIITSDDTSTGGGAAGGGNIGGSTSNGTGGGSAACATADECAPPAVECVEATCDAGACGEQPSLEGTICTAGICDGAGNCVECIADDDCDTAAGETCDTTTKTCTAPQQLMGACGQNFCQLAPADSTCANCLISELGGNGQCSSEGSACLNDNGTGCKTCNQWIMGGQGTFCPGSEAKAQAVLDCVCQVGVCAE